MTSSCGHCPQIIEVACGVKLNPSCRFAGHWRASASAAPSGRSKAVITIASQSLPGRGQLIVCLPISLETNARAVSLQPLARPACLPLVDQGGRGDLLPFWGAVFDAHFPPAAYSAPPPPSLTPLSIPPPTLPCPPPPSILINSRLHEGKQLISPTKVTVTWAAASGGYLPAANERRRGEVRERKKKKKAARWRKEEWGWVGTGMVCGREGGEERGREGGSSSPRILLL